MMNFDLAARALSFGCQVALLYGMLSITAAGVAAIGGLVMDSIAAAPSTFGNSIRVAMNSSEANAEASRRRVGAAVVVVLALVLLCFGGLVASAALSSSESAATVAPSKLALIVVVSAMAFAAYAAVEFLVIVASVVVTAAATFVSEIVMAVPSARTTFEDRIDVVMFELVGKWVCNAAASVPKKSATAPKVDAAVPKTVRAAAAPKTTRPAATVPEKKPKKTVSFGTVQVQEYRVTLGDHPLCKRYPMTMDWSHTEPKEVELNAYEHAKSTKGRRPAMNPRDRQVRIAEVTGVCPKVVHDKEHRRRRKLEGTAKKATATTPEPATTSKPTKNVSFGKVEIREYSLTLGDHPCCDSYPLSLDWGHTKAETYDLDRLEQAKSNVPRPDLTPNQRLARIAQVTGFEASVIEKKERLRIRKLKDAAEHTVVVDQQQQQPANVPMMVSASRTGKSLGGYHEV